MNKKSPVSDQESQVTGYLKDVETLLKVPTSSKYKKLLLEEYPFDNQLLCASRIYRESRKLYYGLGGTFVQKLSSTMRSLSAHDLFKNEIEFSPAWSELLWFKDHVEDVVDPDVHIQALTRFSDISLFHEQNHRVIWRILPPAPKEERAFSRYLNFSESLVVTLDLALGDELGKKLSPVFERMKVVYRDGGEDKWYKESRKVYRQYLMSVLCSTYYALETMHSDDILDAVNYVFPRQKRMNKDAVHRSLGISELFARITNPLWQERYWKTAQMKLAKIHSGSQREPLYLAEDPLDLEDEFAIARDVFEIYGL